MADGASVTEECELRAFVNSDSKTLVLACGDGMFVELPAMPGLND